MKNNTYDIVIVGSGPSGVHSAYPLVEKGLRVAMIDGGLDSKAGDVFEKTNQILKIQSNIKINQSLAKGGLSEVWPGICDYFTKKELNLMGLPADEILSAYNAVANLINLKLKPSLDIHGESILDSRRGVYQLPQAFSYRTSSVVDDLKKFKNFTYVPNQLVLKVKEKKEYIEIQSLSINKEVESYTKARFLILAAGSLNTTRILLRSFNLYNSKVPFLTKNYYAIVCLNIKSLIKKGGTKKEFGQVAISNNDFFIQFYRCNPYSLHRALPYIPFHKLFSFAIQSFTPYLVIADVRFPAIAGKEKFVRLIKTGNEDILEISFHYKNSELQKHQMWLRKINRQLINLGLLPLKTIKGGVTSHYANGVPIKDTPGILSTDSNGKLHQAKRTYIADSSTWRMLPAGPPTLTIMANAARIGKQVLKKFQ